MKKIIKRFLPKAFKKAIYKLIRRTPVHIKDVFGFDLYQISDGINYKKFCGKSFIDVQDTVDGRIFYTMNRYITKDSVAIDVGANIGLMTLAMSKLVGTGGRVYSFEPGPVSFGLLRRNVYSNLLNGNVSISDNALSDSEGSFNLFISGSGESDNQLHKDTDTYVFKDEESRPSFKVTTKTLDAFVSENCIDCNNISFVKVDTQGHDLAVLRGGRTLFTNASKIAVLAEFAPYLKAWENQTIDDFYHELVSYGFDIYDDSNLNAGKVDLDYLKSNFGQDLVGKYTDLLLLKGQSF
jgi:FkbM family methyltransferase